MPEFGKNDFLLTSAGRIDKQKACGGVAQSVEQRTENPRVPSSILGPATNYFIGLAQMGWPFLFLYTENVPPLPHLQCDAATYGNVIVTSFALRILARNRRAVRL
jgi:hypothetical protein